MQRIDTASAPQARQMAMEARPATKLCVVWRSQPIATGPKKPPRLPMELMTAMCAADMGPARRTVEALQKIGIAARTPMAARVKPAMAMKALGAKAARRKPEAAVR